MKDVPPPRAMQRGVPLLPPLFGGSCCHRANPNRKRQSAPSSSSSSGTSSLGCLTCYTYTNQHCADHLKVYIYTSESGVLVCSDDKTHTFARRRRRRAAADARRAFVSARAQRATHAPAQHAHLCRVAVCVCACMCVLAPEIALGIVSLSLSISFAFRCVHAYLI